MSSMRPFCMPKWGIEMTEGTIVEWMVGDGDAIRKGDVLCLVETAKITNEIEAERDGVMLRIVAPAGDQALPVGALLAVIGDSVASSDEIGAFVGRFVPEAGGIGAREAGGGEEVADVEPRTVTIDTNRPISPKAFELAQAQSVDLAAIEGSGRGGRITFQDVYRHVQPAGETRWRGPVALVAEEPTAFASPLARRIAAVHGIDLATLTGTGPRGRISKHDVLAAVAVAAPAPRDQTFVRGENPPQIERFDKIRTVVARRLVAAKQDIPHFYLHIAVAVDELLALRKTANLLLGCKASVNDFIVFAVAKALVRHRELNIQVHGEAIHRFAHADIAIAVASPKGLVTPILHQVDRMRIDQIAQASAALIDKARAGRLAFADLDGGTFTISNLGMFGIEAFDAIINPPHGAILAVGQAQRAVCEMADGDIGFATRMALTLSVDHRAIDGAAAAQFLATLKSLIENPEQLFAQPG
jgi:pyruvate dehydrogenase E2 component (dihydrolipoamide acetyltransferase)